MEFNKENFIKNNTGDLSLFEYIKSSKIDKIKDDGKKEYLLSLYYSLIYFNNCIILYEQNDNITKNNIYDVYVEIKMLLLKELKIPKKWLEL